MPSRLQQFKVYPWTGGLVTSIDESLIQPGQLTRADNVVFSTQGTRLKREGINSDFDDLAIVSVSRSSSGVNRTIRTTGYKWTIGDQLTVSGAGNSNYNTGTATATVSAVGSSVTSPITFTRSTSVVTITNASPGVVSWTAHGLNDGDTVFFTSAGTLPAPLAVNTLYYVVNKNTDDFQVALTSGGTAINTTTAGSGVHTAYSAKTLVTWTAHPLVNGDTVAFTSTGALPTGITANQYYFVKASATDTFEIAATSGGVSLNSLTVGSGTQTARKTLEDVITYTFSGATSLAEGTTADIAMVVTLKTKVIYLLDYWYGATSAKTQKIMALTSTGRIIEIDPSTGVRTFLVDIGVPYTVPSGGILRGCLITFDNRLMIAVEGTTNGMKHYFPTTLGGSGYVEDVTNTTGFESTPKPSFLQVHLGRLWCNDKANPDRLHYCETGSYNVWQGAGDSGAMDIGPGDGDPEGLTAIFPPFKGVMFVAKRTKLYKISGQFPETFFPDRVASSLGCVAHQAVAAVDQDDVLFVSDKGIHSSQATDAYGDFAQSYASADIQESINSEWNRSRQKYIQAAYLPQINSVGFCVADEGDSSQLDLWLFNVALKQWYRWPRVNCTSICLVNDSDRQRFYFGRNDCRVSQSFTGDNFDVAVSGTETSVTMTLVTGLIFPSGNFLDTNAYKKLVLIYKPQGSYTLQASIKIDNFSPQSLVYNDTRGQDLLGTTFILNSSVLGLGQVTASYTQSIDGYGHGFKLTISQAGVNEFGEILGFAVYYESAESGLETRASSED